MVQSSGKSGRGRAAGLNHLAFELENELELLKSYEKALKEDIPIERTLDHDIAHSVYIADPDGNSCELYADVIKDWRNARTGLVTKPKPEWWPGATKPIEEPMYDPNPQIERVENAIFHPQKTTYACLTVNNLEKSLNFYQEVIGLQVIHGSVESGYALLAGTTNELCLILVQKTDFEKNQLHHVGLLVADLVDLSKSIEKCKESNPNIIKKIVETNHSLSIFIEDEDGIPLKLYANKDAKQSFNDFSHDNILCI